MSTYKRTFVDRHGWFDRLRCDVCGATDEAAQVHTEVPVEAPNSTDCLDLDLCAECFHHAYDKAEALVADLCGTPVAHLVELTIERDAQERYAQELLRRVEGQVSA